MFIIEIFILYIVYCINSKKNFFVAIQIHRIIEWIEKKKRKEKTNENSDVTKIIAF